MLLHNYGLICESILEKDHIWNNSAVRNKGWGPDPHPLFRTPNPLINDEFAITHK